MNILSLLAGSVPAAICLIIGLALVILEMMMPGFGIPGIAGIALLAAGIWITGGTTAEMLILAGIVLVLLLIALPFCMRSIAKGRFSKSRIVLGSVSLNGSKQDESALVGKEGVAQTMLRPVGIALIGEERLSVVAGGEFIEMGKKVRVTKVEGNRIVVEKVK